MSRQAESLKMGYVVKMFPRLSETFILNEILELEKRGVEVVIFSVKKPNEGRFHPQLSRLKAKVLYLEDLDTKKWAAWLSKEWPVLSRHGEGLWKLLQQAIEVGDFRRIDHIWWSAWLAAQAEKMGLERLHAHFASLPSTIAYLTHCVSGIPFSFTAHAKDIFVYTPEEHGLREKMMAADFVVTVTDFNRRYLLEQIPEVKADKIHVIRNGVNLDRFEDESTAREPDLILGVGRLVPKKGFGDLLDACALLKKNGTRFRCVIAGAGPEQSALEGKRLELGLENEVTLAGAKHQDEVFDMMRRAAVFCLPCTLASDGNQDALPTVLLESLACGLPIVSTSLSGVPEIVDEGVNGFLVPPDDPSSLAERLAALLSSPDQRVRFGVEGRKKAAEAFDLSKNVETLVELYLGGANSNPRASTANVTDGEGRSRDNVLYLCADRGIAFGGSKGASVHIREFANALHTAGYSPHVVMVKRDPSSGYTPPYPVSVAPGSVPTSFFNQAGQLGEKSPSLDDIEEFARNEPFERMLEDVHGRNRFNVVYERYSLFGTAGRQFAKKAGVPYVMEINAPLVLEAPNYRKLAETDLAKAVEKYLFKTADHIVTVSDALRDYVLTVAPEAAVTVLPNAVDMNRFQDNASDNGWRSRLTSDPDRDFVIGFVGRVRPWHGLGLLVDAVGKLAETDDSIRLCVVGQCGDLQDELTDRCNEAGLNGRVSFVGPVAPDEVPLVLNGMDVLTAPYPALDNFYFSPLKIFEYMAAARPIVASKIGQIPGVLTDEKTALLVPPGDTSALADALRRLREDSKLRRTLGTNARAEVAAKHTWEHRVRTVAGILDGLDKRVDTDKLGHANTI